MKGKKIIKGIAFISTLALFFASSVINKSAYNSSLAQPTDTTRAEKIDLKYPFKDENRYSISGQEATPPLYFDNPSNVKSAVEYDPETNEYTYTEKVGSLDFRRPNVMSFKEFHEYEAEMAKRKYWLEKSQEDKTGRERGLAGTIKMGETFDKVFGTDAINIVPQGSAELIFGYNISRIDNPALSERNRRNGAFTFKEKIQMNVTGSIGDKMELGINYNTEATFDFENKTKLEYAGKEDEIIKKIEAGNITLPLTGSLISGSQSLFGLKTELQFGKLTVTNVFSHQRGESSVIDVQGGAQVNEFEVNVDEYDANRHFFLSHFFRENYNEWLGTPPYISSGVRIEQIEVWVTNKTNNFDSDNRNFVAFMDLGESYTLDDGTLIQNFQGPVDFIRPVNQPDYPVSNDANALYAEMVQNYPGIRSIKDIATTLTPLEERFNLRGGNEYEKVENARKLSEREYTLNRELGYISLNSALRTDEVLAVAYVYTYQGKTYRVGEISTEGVSAPNALVLKLIKGTSLTPKLKTWNLMMKNIYSINAYQVNRTDFRLDVLYRNDETGVAMNYIKEPAASPAFHNKILLKVMGLDTLDSRNEPNPDGQFDYIEGTTIISSSGKIIFPLVEPFGKDLRKKITGGSQARDINSIADKYVFEELYDSTQTKASQIAEKNKFYIAGTYQSASSSEIQLNAMNIPRNSVKVSAGGIQLTEGSDYTVDYTLGRVKILNQGLLESGTPLRISLENNALFNLQTKTLVGTHMDYKVSDNFIMGGTLLNLTERPLTQKVNMGDEPISNTIWGLNTSYQTKSQFLTGLIDKLPFLETKEASNISLDAEFAHLIPGQAKAIGRNGRAYIDDFEGTETSIELKTIPSWVLASTPREFREGQLINDMSYNYNRARLAWYMVDPLFNRDYANTPDLPDEDKDNHFTREIYETEIYREKQSGTGIESPLSVFNIAFYPNEKGPYNFDVNPSPFSSGINSNGTLRDPETRWGGIMREIQTSDFENSNVEYIEFWLMDPFVYDSTAPSGSLGGDLFFNLGEISEDILRDSRKTFENGLPASEEITLVDTTVWGRVPRTQSVVNEFNTDPETRQYQDVGLDGLSSTDEADFFSWYLDEVAGVVDPASPEYEQISLDPSSDDFHYYLGSDYDELGLGVLERYKKYNGTDGNSPATEQSGGEFAAASTKPSAEDINRDNTLNETETYYSYSTSIRPEDLEVGKNYIVDKIRGEGKDVDWYLFRIPISDYKYRYGNIEDFKSIRFLRMYLKDFNKPVILRFAELQLIRGEWRKYRFDMYEGGPGLAGQVEDGSFEITAVNIEENSEKTPVNYILPPDISRVIDPSQPQLAELNEQSMVFRVYNLADGDARVAYKNVDLDLRQYKKLKMYVHAEALANDLTLDSTGITAFIRIGSDYQDNYFEYEVPLRITPAGEYTNGDENERDRLRVWPEANNFNIDLEKLVALRVERDEISYDKTRIYPKFDNINNRNKMKVRGTPNLSNIRTIMIGVRNPGDADNQYPNDGLPKSAEIWFNELRLEDFNNKGGWAANARVQLRLADLGTLSVAGSTIQPGFGSIEQKVMERKHEQLNQYDISSNLELGKFFPEKAKVSIPAFVGVSKSIINPEYAPKEPDRLLKDVLDKAETKAERDEIKKVSQDITERKSINFTNVRVAKEFKKLKPLSPANLSVSAGYSDVKSHSYKVERNDLVKYRAGINYTYAMRPVSVIPFKKTKGMNSPYLRLIKDFNFSPVPSQFTFRTDIDRYYNEIKLRNVLDKDIRIDSSVNKDFTWNRFYMMQWQLTRSIKVDFSATNIARIDEPTGAYDLFREGNNQYWKDSVWRSIRNFGTNNSYNHTFNASYTLPINKIPLLNWISSSVSYSGKFFWDRGPVYEGGYTLGHTIRNANTMQFTNQLNLMNLYYKVGFIKRIDAKYKGAKKPESEKKYKTVTFSRRTFLKAGQPKNIVHKLGTTKLTVTVLDADNKEVEVETEIVNENKIAITSETDIAGITVNIEGQIEKGENPVIFIAENSVRFLTGLKSVTINYSRNGGTNLMGYNNETDMFGLTSTSTGLAPGIPFILGWQDSSFVKNAARNQWLTTNPAFSNPYSMQFTENLNLQGTFEPFRGLRIDIKAQRMYSQNISEYFLPPESAGGNFSFANRIQNGNFMMSVITIGSAFEKLELEDNFKSEYFENFKRYRTIISGRLYNKRVQESGIGYSGSATAIMNYGYADGYGPTSAEVIIPAFLAAYTGKDPGKVTLEPFPGFLSMLPNWSLNFDGLSRIGFFKRFANSINIRHTYQSSYNIGSYTTYTDLTFAEDGIAYIRDFNNNFYPEYLINSVSITEKISPLINVNITWKNNLLTRFEIGKSRTLALGLANNQVTDTRNDDLIIGSGYRFKEVPLTINNRTVKSDLNLRVDFSVRDNKTVIRHLAEDIEDEAEQVTAGQRIVKINVTADYALSPRFNLQFFFDRTLNKPYSSGTFLTVDTNIGFSIKFSLQ
ncbi:MAG: cell surface protein SprA [Bacteroidales bacterium]|nr:cell surface protein SprA [Bacteroidales bacterium]